MNRVWGFLPQGLKERPFDLYTALALVAVGVFGIIDPNFPEKTSTSISALLFMVIQSYFIVASIVLAIAILIDTKKYPKFSFFGQMLGWAFIAAAGISVMTYQLWQNVSTPIPTEELNLYWLVFFVFGCVGWAAFFRSANMLIELIQLNRRKS
jgi:drug/metabolite transporter (DMT)-like permease